MRTRISAPGAGLRMGVGPGGEVGIVPDWRQQKANMDFHAFGTPRQNATRANQLYREAVRSGDALRLGTYMHFLQDEFSHFDFAGNPVMYWLSLGCARMHFLQPCLAPYISVFRTRYHQGKASTVREVNAPYLP